MYARQQSAPRAAAVPQRALILARREGAVRADLAAMRGIGLHSFHLITDAGEALGYLKERCGGLPGVKAPDKTPDVIICDENFGGAPVAVFLHALASDPALRGLPLLLLASSEEGAANLAALGVHTLARPYTPDALQAVLRKAMSPLRPLLRPESFAPALQDQARPKVRKKRKTEKVMTTSDWFALGMAWLRTKQNAKARKAFLMVLKRSEDHVGAALGLARINRAEGDVQAMRRYLLRAAAACLRRGDKAYAASIAALLPPGMRDKIFMHEALGRMEEGAYREAALSFLDAGREEAKSLHGIISRACLLTPKPEEGMHKLCEAFEGLGRADTALVLRKRLLSYRPYSVARRSSWLDRFPRLKEVVCVASYTARAWKEA